MVGGNLFQKKLEKVSGDHLGLKWWGIWDLELSSDAPSTLPVVRVIPSPVGTPKSPVGDLANHPHG